MRTGGNITDELIETWGHPRIRLDIDGTSIYESDIGANSFSLRGGCSSGGALAPGGCVTASCSFTLMNFDGIFNSLSIVPDEKVEVYCGFGEKAETTQYDKIATVYIADISRKKNIISCVCYDGLRKGDSINFVRDSLNMTVSQIISEAAQEAGISVGQLPSVGGDIQVNLPDGCSMTCRQAIMYALELSGNFGYMDANDQLVCKWFDFTPVMTVPSGDYIGAEFYEATGYTGVQVEGGEISGTLPYIYVLSGNPFVTTDNLSAVTSRLYTALVGADFNAGSVTIYCDPRLEPGDTVAVTYVDGTGTDSIKKVPVTSYTLKASMGMTLQCESQTADQIVDQRSTQGTINDEVEQGTGGGGSGDYIEKTNGTGTETSIENAHIWRTQGTGYNPSSTSEKVKSWGVEAILTKQDNDGDGKHGATLYAREVNPLMIVGSTAVSLVASLWTEVQSGDYQGWYERLVLLRMLPDDFPRGTDSVHGDSKTAIMPRAWGNVRVPALGVEVDYTDGRGIGCQCYVSKEWNKGTYTYGVWAYLFTPSLSNKIGPIYVDYMVIGGNQVNNGGA